MKKIVIQKILFFLVFLPILAWAEEGAFEQSQEVKKVTVIEVEGNTSINTNTILSKMKTKVGSPYLDNIISDDIKRLYLLGYFSDISVETTDYEDGVKVKIIVVERPVIKKITFRGFRHLYTKDERFKKAIKTKEAQYLDYPTLKEDCQRLKDMYVKKGFSQAEVSFKVETDPQTQEAQVEFKAQESRRMKIKKIYIEGNNAFRDKRILRIMKTKRAWFFGRGILREEVLEEDMERIRSFYQSHGFSDLVVDYLIKADPKRPNLLYISVVIQEGEQYFVGKIKIEGNKAITEAQIREKISVCLPGKIFSNEGIKQDKFSILGLYFDQGYISANVREITSLDPSTGQVNITYNIEEFEMIYVNKIKIRGNIKTKDVVIRRELRIFPGDEFNGENLRRSRERLTNLGFFEEISFDTQATDIADQRDLIVEVKETKTGMFSFGGGYSTVDEFIGFIEIEQKNFDWKNWPYFTGDGQNLRLRAEMGTVNENFNLSFTEPWLFDYPVSFGFDAYRVSHDREGDVGWGYDEKRTGSGIRLGKELSEHVRGRFNYCFERVKIGDVLSTASTDLKDEEGTNDISSIGLGLTYDSRDNVFNPRKGILAGCDFTLAGGPVGGDKDFFRIQTNTSKFFPLFRGSSLEMRARTGFVADYHGQDVPIYERFFAGGAYTIRGYEERTVGPFDRDSKDPLGGRSMFIGNIEYTYPVFEFLRLATFYDTGNVWEKIGDFGKKGFKNAVGLGLRLKTPIGPIRLDYGIPLNIQPGEERKKSGRVHFSMSHGF
ncbi:MAG: outer membrane protein assembly factor BamA [Candidatus Omnitrophica bacterium]|nr:outer membrane protein assembly factor BamA [Candidatus Omnitrophota bacterium]